MATPSHPPVGFDVGTTFSAAAMIDEEGKPKILAIDEGRETMPSVVDYAEDGKVVVGEKALRKSIAYKDRVVRWIKRSMGKDFSVTVQRSPDAEQEFFTPPEVTAEIMRKLVADIEPHVGSKVTKAVITVPAWFDDLARSATQEAGKLIGLEVLRLIEEPTAAAIAWGLEHLSDGETVVVYDLGGGTFDCSILEFEGGVLDCVKSQGHPELGGHDWTLILQDHVAEKCTEIYGFDPMDDSEFRWQIYEKCERAKRFLSNSPQQTIALTYTTVDEDGNEENQLAEVTVTQQEFEDMTDDKLQITLNRTEDALNMAGKSWDDVDHILLVGGSTRLRRVAEALKDLSGKDPVITDDVDRLVALGAAIVAAKEMGDKVAVGDKGPNDVGEIVERSKRALGVVTLGSGEPQFRNEIVIPEGTELEAVGTRTFKTIVPNQKIFQVPVVEGDDEDARDCLINRTYEFTCPEGTPLGSNVKVTFKYDKSNQVSVAAVDERTGKELESQPAQFIWPKGGSGGGAVDLVFVVDATGSMAGCIHGVRHQITEFAKSMIEKKLDYRLGLVVYRDLKESHVPKDMQLKVYGWADETSTFRDWVSEIEVNFGGDEPESALDGIAAAAEMPGREGAARFIVLITDATSHVPDESGRTAEQIGGMLVQSGIKLFGIAPNFEAYRTMVEKANGTPDDPADLEADLVDFDKYFRVGVVDVPLFQEKLQQLGSQMIDTLLGT